MPAPSLPSGLERLVRDARTATLATIRPDGRPRLVPVCFVVSPGAIGPGSVLHTPLDLKPKRLADPHGLARVRDILARPEVELLVDRWDEDWGRLAWIRLGGVATLIEPGDPEGGLERSRVIEALRSKYPQYREQRLDDRPLLRIETQRMSWWRASDRSRP